MEYTKFERFYKAMTEREMLPDEAFQKAVNMFIEDKGINRIAELCGNETEGYHINYYFPDGLGKRRVLSDDVEDLTTAIRRIMSQKRAYAARDRRTDGKKYTKR